MKFGEIHMVEFLVTANHPDGMLYYQVGEKKNEREIASIKTTESCGKEAICFLDADGDVIFESSADNCLI
ncbi:hypothetical protein, partial [Tumebacillus flagellatus]|uniref:hypothetical protein n=1 Tax=Tumebacillus flagellatus TaxID=1157490 RepID=UPI00057206BF